MARYRRLSKALTNYISFKEDERGAIKKPISRPSSISVKKNIWDLIGKVVIIAEKPKAARRIVEALSYKTKPKLYRSNGVPYWIIRSSALELYVVPSAGHLFGLYTSKWGYPTFTYEWRPLYEIDKKSSYTRKFINLLSKICREANYYINACDYDIEGSVIGYMIIKYFGDPHRSLRAKFSSLTPYELRKAFTQLTDLDWNMVEAGLCRHELDWIWGINVSRALMDSIKTVSGKRLILSAGRVQTPTLKYVVENEVERYLFIPLPQYSISATIIVDGERYTLEYKGDSIETRNEAEALVKSIKDKKYLKVVDYKEEYWNINPPPPFNLGDLQAEAARIYGFSPYKTQSIAEQLYLNAYISYPRTNSQKLPKDLNYRSILNNIAKIYQYNSLVKQLLAETKGVLKPVEGPKEDPAHPAIYPTGIIPKGLKSDEQKIYDLIVRRFLAVFAYKAKIVHKIAYFKPLSRSPEILFTLSGKEIVEEGWYKYYPFHRPSEKYIPKFKIGQLVSLYRVSVRKSYTKPPDKLSKIRILKWMENSQIGTEATRARIIEILFSRRYLVSKSGKVDVTDLGLAVIEVLDEYFNELTSIELTRKFENYMEQIRFGRMSRDRVIVEARNTLEKLIREFNAKKKEVGLKLSWRLKLLTPNNKCRLCHREEYMNGLCRYHYSAFTKITEFYKEWKRREGVSWEEYIKALKSFRNTGKWIKEVLESMSHSMGPK